MATAETPADEARTFRLEELLADDAALAAATARMTVWLVEDHLAGMEAAAELLDGWAGETFGADPLEHSALMHAAGRLRAHVAVTRRLNAEGER